MPDQPTRGAACAASLVLCVIYIGRREFAEAGGLMSCGANIADAWRQAFAVPPTLLARADEVIE